MKFKDARQNTNRLFDAHGGDTQVPFVGLAIGARILGSNYSEIYSQKGWDKYRLPPNGFTPIMSAEKASEEREQNYAQIMEKRGGNGKTAIWGIEAMDAFLKLEHMIELIHLRNGAGVKLKVQLTYNHQNHLATGCRVAMKEKNGVWRYDQTTGLSTFGRNMARLLAQNGIIVDVSHLNTQSALDVASETERTGQPIIASHASTRVVFSENKLSKGKRHPCFVRALDDTVIRAVLRSGGFIGITPHPYLLFGKSGAEVETEYASDGTNPTLEVMAKNLEHVRTIARKCGTDVERAVALASDSELDENGKLVQPAGYTPQTYPQLFLELGELLRERNWSQSEIEALMGGNAARVFGI